MSRSRLLFFVGAACSIFGLGPALGADAAADAREAQLREALRAARQELQSAQNELASLRADQAALTDQRNNLTEQVETLRKHAIADKTAADEAASKAKAQLTEREAEIVHLNETAGRWKSSSEEQADLARKTEAERARLEAENTALQRALADREAKNLELYKLANEILVRYEKFSLGEALSAKEPFVGRTRVRLENLVQEYADKILDQRAKP